MHILYMPSTFDHALVESVIQPPKSSLRLSYFRTILLVCSIETQYIQQSCGDQCGCISIVVIDISATFSLNVACMYFKVPKFSNAIAKFSDFIIFGCKINDS